MPLNSLTQGSAPSAGIVTTVASLWCGNQIKSDMTVQTEVKWQNLRPIQDHMWNGVRLKNIWSVWLPESIIFIL